MTFLWGCCCLTAVSPAGAGQCLVFFPPQAADETQLLPTTQTPRKRALGGVAAIGAPFGAPFGCRQQRRRRLELPRLPDPLLSRPPQRPASLLSPLRCCYGSAGGGSQSPGGKDIFVAVATRAAARRTNGEEAGRRRGAAGAARRPREPRAAVAAEERGLGGERGCQDRANAALAGCWGAAVGQHLFRRVCQLGFTQGPPDGNKRVCNPSKQHLFKHKTSDNNKMAFHQNRGKIRVSTHTTAPRVAGASVLI